MEEGAPPPPPPPRRQRALAGGQSAGGGRTIGQGPHPYALNDIRQEAPNPVKANVGGSHKALRDLLGGSAHDLGGGGGIAAAYTTDTDELIRDSDLAFEAPTHPLLHSNPSHCPREPIPFPTACGLTRPPRRLAGAMVGGELECPLPYQQDGSGGGGGRQGPPYERLAGQTGQTRHAPGRVRGAALPA